MQGKFDKSWPNVLMGNFADFASLGSNMMAYSFVDRIGPHVVLVVLDRDTLYIVGQDSDFLGLAECTGKDIVRNNYLGSYLETFKILYKNKILQMILSQRLINFL